MPLIYFCSGSFPRIRGKKRGIKTPAARERFNPVCVGAVATEKAPIRKPGSLVEVACRMSAGSMKGLITCGSPGACLSQDCKWRKAAPWRMWTHTHVGGEAASQPIPAPPLAGPACGGRKWKAIPRWRVLVGIQRPALSRPMASEDRLLVREPEPDSLLMFNNCSHTCVAHFKLLRV